MDLNIQMEEETGGNFDEAEINVEVEQGKS